MNTPSTLDDTGLTLESNTDIVDDLVSAFQLIYGSDININSNSPDGQIINIFAQWITDTLELLQDIYNSFTVENAYGVQLDQRVALNGLARLAGTYTLAQVAITVSKALTLYGLDQTAQPVFTVQDNAGNQYQLVTTNAFSGGGIATLTFQAVNIGQVETIVNTIQNQVTVVLGVTNVNNPSVSSDVIGSNEESDVELKIRHGKSFALAATGPADSIEAMLKTVANVVDALVIENDTNATVTYGAVNVLAHSIWAIVNGGVAANIGQAIYSKKCPGCGMTGSQSYVVTRPNGTTFTALWDNAVGQPLYMKFTALQKYPNVPINTAFYPAALAEVLDYKLGQNPTIADIITAMATIDPNAVITFGAGQGLSEDNSTFEIGTVTPTTPQNFYQVTAGNITVTT